MTMFPIETGEVYANYDETTFASSLFAEYPDAPYSDEGVATIFYELNEYYGEELSYDDICSLFVEYDNYSEFCRAYDVDESLDEDEQDYLWDRMPFSYTTLENGHVMLLR